MCSITSFLIRDAMMYMYTHDVMTYVYIHVSKWLIFYTFFLKKTSKMITS